MKKWALTFFAPLLEQIRPVEDQTEFDLSESDRTILEIFDGGNCNEYGCEAGELDWPTL